MHIDWAHFTPWSAMSGGVLIGLATLLLALSLGKIAGISSILAGLAAPWRESQWRWAFIVGMLLTTGVWQAHASIVVAIQASPWVLIASGVLVGLGTRLASGCTSGHGVCGLARGSLRSLVATTTFMLAAFITVASVQYFV